MDSKKYKEPKEFNDVNLYDCLNAYFNNNYNKEKKICINCKKETKFIKKIKLISLPIYLIIQLDRYNENKEKIVNKKSVNYPIQNLILNRYIKGDENGSTYDLYAIITHDNDWKKGNFEAICENGNKWIKYNYECVNLVNDIDSENACFLFYKKK